MISSTGDTSPFQMYNSEGRLGQLGDGEASVNVYIYKCLVILIFLQKNLSFQQSYLYQTVAWIDPFTLTQFC
jgi:hypothetical protein